MRKMRIFQKDAYISMDFNDGVADIFYLENQGHSLFENGTLALSLGQIDAGSVKKDIKYNRLHRDNVNPLREELVSFIDAVKNDLKPAVTIDEGLSALKLAYNILKQIDRHQEYLKKHSDLN